MAEVQQRWDNITPLPQGNEAETSIQQFYNGATIFITGGTGFVGQLIIEKLLRCCPGVKKIYVLARARKNKDANSRLQEQFKGELYDKLREVDPNFVDKVEAVVGDCGELGLGISNDERSTLMDEVTVIFHSAATVRFDEPLKLAAEINTRGPREIIALAKGCRNLKALVHISTAYSNSYEPVIKEKFYEVELPGDKLIDMVENMDEDALNRITPGLISRHPNTYTYTKKAAEDIVRTHGQYIPCCVVRPSIITGTAKEPLEGWSGNLYGLAGAFLGAGMGIIHTMPINAQGVVDIVPCDYVSNTCIAAAWQTSRLWRRGSSPTSEPQVFMCGTSPQTPIIWSQLLAISEQHYTRIPLSQAIYKVLFLKPASIKLYNLFAILLHWIPAYIVDAFLAICGKKQQFKKLYAKVDHMIGVLSYFSTNSWVFHNENTMRMYQDLSKRDKSIFYFDFANFDWSTYMFSYCSGLRIYMAKDPMETIPQGKRRMWFLEVLHYVICSAIVLFFYGVFNLFYKIFF